MSAKKIVITTTLLVLFFLIANASAYQDADNSGETFVITSSKETYKCSFGACEEILFDVLNKDSFSAHSIDLGVFFQSGVEVDFFGELDEQHKKRLEWVAYPCDFVSGTDSNAVSAWLCYDSNSVLRGIFGVPVGNYFEQEERLYTDWVWVDAKAQQWQNSLGQGKIPSEFEPKGAFKGINIGKLETKKFRLKLVAPFWLEGQHEFWLQATDKDNNAYYGDLDPYITVENWVEKKTIYLYASGNIDINQTLNINLNGLLNTKPNDYINTCNDIRVVWRETQDLSRQILNCGAASDFNVLFKAVRPQASGTWDMNNYRLYWWNLAQHNAPNQPDQNDTIYWFNDDWNSATTQTTWNSLDWNTTGYIVIGSTSTSQIEARGRGGLGIVGNNGNKYGVLAKNFFDLADTNSGRVTAYIQYSDFANTAASITEIAGFSFARDTNTTAMIGGAPDAIALKLENGSASPTLVLRIDGSNDSYSRPGFVDKNVGFWFSFQKWPVDNNVWVKAYYYDDANNSLMTMFDANMTFNDASAMKLRLGFENQLGANTRYADANYNNVWIRKQSVSLASSDANASFYDVNEDYWGNGAISRKNSYNLDSSNKHLALGFTAKNSKVVNKIYLLAGFEGIGVRPTYNIGIVDANFQGFPNLNNWLTRDTNQFTLVSTDSGFSPARRWIIQDVPYGIPGRHADLNAGEKYFIVIDHNSGTIDASNYSSIATGLIPHRALPNITIDKNQEVFITLGNNVDWVAQNDSPIYLICFTDNSCEGNPSPPIPDPLDLLFDVDDDTTIGQIFYADNKIDINSVTIYVIKDSGTGNIVDMNVVLTDMNTDTNMFNVVVVGNPNTSPNYYTTPFTKTTLLPPRQYRLSLVGTNNGGGLWLDYLVATSDINRSQDSNLLNNGFGGTRSFFVIYNSSGWQDYLTMDLGFKFTYSQSAYNYVPSVRLDDPNTPKYLKGGSDVNINFDAKDYDLLSNADGNLFANLFYSVDQNRFTTSIALDVNLFSKTALTCASTNFTSFVDCNYSWNVPALDGNYYVDINVFDDFDANASDSSDYSFYIDSTKPSTRWDGNIGVWKNADTNIHLTCVDASNNCPNTKYRLDSDSSSGVALGSWIAYDKNILFISDGNYGIDYNSTDMAGNIGDTNRQYVLVDKTIPNTRADYNSSWQKVDANVLFVCSDANAGCSSTGIRKDSDSSANKSFGAWITGTASDLNAFFTKDGNWGVDFNSTDSAGNVEDTNTIYVLIDKTAPTTVWDNNGEWQTTDQNIHLTCTDANSGCQTTKYRLDTLATNAVSYGAWQNYDTNLLVIGDGNYALDFNSTDNAENIETTNTKYALINKGLDLNASPPNLDVTTELGTIYEYAFTLTNNNTNDTGSLNIYNYCPESLIQLNKSSTSIAVGASDTFSLKITPLGTDGFFNCYIHLSNNLVDQKIMVSVWDKTGDTGNTGGIPVSSDANTTYNIIDWPNPPIISVGLGASKEIRFKVKNTGGTDINLFVVGSQGSIAKYLTISEARSQIDANSEKQYILTASLPQDAELLDYDGIILFFDGKNMQTQQLIISATKPGLDLTASGVLSFVALNAKDFAKNIKTIFDTSIFGTPLTIGVIVLVALFLVWIGLVVVNPKNYFHFLVLGLAVFTIILMLF